MQAASGHIFACTNKSEKECFDRMLFATSRIYGENVLKIKKGDLLFLLNLDNDRLYGTFRAKSKGARDIVPEAWNGGTHIKFRCCATARYIRSRTQERSCQAWALVGVTRLTASR